MYICRTRSDCDKQQRFVFSGCRCGSCISDDSSGESEVCEDGLVPQRLQDVWKAQVHAHFLFRRLLVPRPKTRQLLLYHPVIYAKAHRFTGICFVSGRSTTWCWWTVPWTSVWKSSSSSFWNSCLLINEVCVSVILHQGRQCYCLSSHDKRRV